MTNDFPQTSRMYFPKPCVIMSRHQQITAEKYYCVGNCSSMAALGAGRARTLRPPWHMCALAKRRASYGMKMFSPPPCSSFLFIFSRFAPLFLYQLSSSLFFHQPATQSINNLHARLGSFTPLRKILTVNHYLRSHDFQHSHAKWPGVILHDDLKLKWGKQIDANSRISRSPEREKKITSQRSY